MKGALVALVLAGPGAVEGVGQDEVPATELERPRFTFLRYQEDWSVLRGADPASLTDFWDPIKYIQLNEDGSMWVSFGGSTRLRMESWSNFTFGDTSESNDVFVLWRALLHADFHIGENVRAFIQGKIAQSSSRSLPGGRRVLDVDSIDLEQAFVDFTFPFGEDVSLKVRGPRQAFSFGKQRLVSPLSWGKWTSSKIESWTSA